MNESGVYIISSNIKKDRIYVGSSFNIKIRWNEHKNLLKKGIHHSVKLQRHYNKYGENDLLFKIIEPCLSDWLLVREQYYLDNLKPYFNTCTLAYSCLGVKRSDRVKEKISKSGIGLKRPVSFCQKNRARMLGNNIWSGRKHKPETIQKMKKPKTEEFKQKMRKPKSDAHIKKLKQSATEAWKKRKTKLKIA